LQKQKLKSISLTNTKKGGDGDENLAIINKTKHSTKGERKRVQDGRTQVLWWLDELFSGVSKGKRTPQFMFSSQHPSPPKA
jgi:hypothetical protein